jgi:protein-L-isoaspartate(D-aspartate) O-methyltransferase
LTEEDYAERRRRMVAEQLKSRDIHDPQVLEVMSRVPRHELVPPESRSSAYGDHPVPIGEGQTISQPYIVALMTQILNPKPEHRVLEVGTGSGYQAAVLAELVSQVYTIEIVPFLAERARKDLKRLGYTNIEVRQGDGYEGWPELAPFDLIVVTAAAPTVPEPLLDQLAEKGRLVMPVGAFQGFQTLELITRNKDKFERKRITGVRFVPMTGKVEEIPQ